MAAVLAPPTVRSAVSSGCSILGGGVKVDARVVSPAEKDLPSRQTTHCRCVLGSGRGRQADDADGPCVLRQADSSERHRVDGSGGGHQAPGVVEDLDPGHTGLARRSRDERAEPGWVDHLEGAGQLRISRDALGVRRGDRGVLVIDGDRRLQAGRQSRVRLPGCESLLTKSRMAISAAVGTIAISRKRSARRRPNLTLRQRILGPRLAWLVSCEPTDVDPPTRGYSSVGRAPGSHPGGRRFESD